MKIVEAMKIILLDLLLIITGIVKGRKLQLMLFYLLTSEFLHAGVVEIFPSLVAPVCQVGDRLELTCSVTGAFLIWEFAVSQENGSPVTFRPDVTSDGPSGVASPVMVNSTTFSFSRLSAQDGSPLISRMTIIPVSEGLNGVQVSCMDVEVSESATTTIRIIDARGRKFHSI